MKKQGGMSMSKMQKIIQDLKLELCCKYSRMIILEGLFVDTSAGGVVWKNRKAKTKRNYRGNNINISSDDEGEIIRKYAYYQYMDKRNPKGKRKRQKYICLADWEWAFKWIEERRKQWEELVEIKKSVKCIIRALKALGEMNAESIIEEVRVRREKTRIKKMKGKAMKRGCVYETVKGDMVRSKAERQIANELFALGIPYEYEKKMIIKGKRVIPDFTLILKGKTVIWEHLGMLDDKRYAAKWKQKKRVYQTANIREGENLILSYHDDISFIEFIKKLQQF